MSPPIDIDGSEIKRATIDGEDVSEITIDGQQTAGFVDGLLQEGFESGSLSSNYGGNTGSATVQNSTVHAGDHALELGGSKGDTISRIDSDVTVERGGVYSGYIRGQALLGSSQREAGILFMTQEATATPGGYYIEMRQDDNDVVVRKSSSGTAPASGTSIASGSLSHSTDTWFEVEFEPKDDGTEAYRIYDTDGNELLSFTSSDGGFSSGGIGFSHGGDSDEYIGYFDDVRQSE